MNVQSTTFRTYATPSRWFDAHGVMKQFKVDEKGRNSGWDCSTGFGVGCVMCALFCVLLSHSSFDIRPRGRFIRCDYFQEKS